MVIIIPKIRERNMTEEPVINDLNLSFEDYKQKKMNEYNQSFNKHGMLVKSTEDEKKLQGDKVKAVRQRNFWIIITISLIFIGGLFFLINDGKFKSEIVQNVTCPTTTCPDIPSCPAAPSCPSCPDCSLSTNTTCNFPSTLTLNIQNHS